MITSKRDLKKHIRRIEEEVSQVLIPAAYLSDIMNEEQAEEALTNLAKLTLEATSRLSIAFDKAPSSFPSMDAYKKARTAYFKAAYNKALTDYENGVNEIIAPINKK